MDWLRRNWPDLLIGVALIAVIAGIIATLISGGSFFPVGNRTAETPRGTAPVTSGQTPGQAQPQTPAAGQQQPGSPVVPADQPPAVAVDPAGAAADEPDEQGAQAQDEQASDDAAPQDQPAGGASVEALPPDAGAEPAAEEPAAPRSSVVSTPNQPATPAEQPAASPSQAAPAGPVPSASGSAEAPYRVSVGAFSSVENAQRQLDAFAAAGYPVFLGTQGNLNIVLVGPYDTEQEARSVAARIAGSGLGVSDPTVYRLQTDEPAGQVGAAPAAPASQPAAPAAEPAASQPAPAAAQPAAEQPAPTSGTRFLQVGAYGSRDSSLPQRERLEGLGFVVSDRVENGLVKLLVGPFESSELASAQARLQSAGIESFPR